MQYLDFDKNIVFTIITFFNYINIIAQQISIIKSYLFTLFTIEFDKALFHIYTYYIMELKYTVTESTRHSNIKQILKSEFNMSDRLILKLKRENKIYCNGISTHINASLNVGDTVCADISFEEESENIVPTKMDLDILYEDSGLLIVNKWQNMPVHPSLNHYEDSLSNGVKFYFDSIGLKRKIRPINRLDKDTTGIVLFAKNEYIQECLVREMKKGIFEKEYLAILDGVLEQTNITVTAPIARKEESIIERCISQDGDYAETLFELIKAYDNYSLVKCILKTGRTHQIRVHSKHIGHPILGDTLYGSSSTLILRQALHAHKVSFIHPITKKHIEIVCPLPYDINNLIQIQY